jgi:anti-sigma factor RsiW
MTNCPTEDVLLDYTAGCLDPVQTALFERHADQCAHCAALRTAQAEVWLRLDEWKPNPVSAGFNRELWRRIDADSQSPSWTSRLAEVMKFDFWKQVAPLAVAVALVVTGYVLDHSGHPLAKPQTNTTASIAVTVSDADQLEQALDEIQLLHQVDAEAAAAKADSRVM